MIFTEHMGRTLTALAVLTVLGACSQPTGSGGSDGDGSGGSTSYPPTSPMVSAVFDETDADITTYRDVASPEMPGILSQSTDPALDELKATFECMEDYIASPAGECDIRLPVAGAASLGTANAGAGILDQGVAGLVGTADKPTPYCYVAGPFSICIYRWQEGTAYITVDDTRGTVTDQWRVYYKGIAGGILFPGDTDDPDDFGYLLQNHSYGTDGKSIHTQHMFEPGLGPECYQRPWAEHTFEVEDTITVATPWGDHTAARRTYTQNGYICWPDDPDPAYRYHFWMGAKLQREPNGDLIIEHRRWSESRKEPYVSAEWLYDASENTISWIFYNDDGTVKDTGQIP